MGFNAISKSLFRFFEIFLVSIVILLLFSVIVLKYYENPRVLISKIFPQTKMIDGYKVNDYMNLQSLQTEAKPVNEMFLKNKANQSVNSIPVLLYHGITPENDGTDTTVADFRKQMFALKANGYQTITLKQLYEFMRGEITLPKKSFVLTFDDGRKDSYYYSDNVLKVLNYSAVMFVVAKYSLEMDHPYYLNKNELQNMVKSGRWEIESHSYDGHSMIPIDQNGTLGSFFGNKMWLSSKGRLETDAEFEKRIYDDLLKSKEVIRKKLGVNVTGFAIPFSDFGQYQSNYINADKVNTNIYNSLFNLVFYQYKPIKNKDFKANYNDKTNQTFYFVMRDEIADGTSPKTLLEQLTAMQAIKLPYNATFENKYRWILNWGNYSIENKSLVLINNNDGNSSTSLVYLDGSYLWKNYNYSVILKNKTEASLALVARFQNEENYAACIFGEGYVLFKNIEAGQTTLIQKVKLQNSSIRPNSKLTMSVVNNTTNCIVNGVSMLTTTSLNLPKYGGVGLKTQGENDSRKSISTKISNIQILKIKE